MRFIPNNRPVIQEMLAEMGVSGLDTLFASIPEAVRLRRGLDLPDGMAETDQLRLLGEMAARNHTRPERTFLGGGSYPHFSPLLADALIQRGEFLTSYTPYQPEISQGTLQAIFEFQTFMTMLTGMDVANASMYDGASATAEAVLLAERAGKDRAGMLLAETLHPHYRAVIETHTRFLEFPRASLPMHPDTGQLDLDALDQALDGQTACVVVQQPNFLGVVEDIAAIAGRVHAAGALLIVAVNEALSMALLEPPGKLGADLVAGEAQSFGLPLNYGGPYLGFMAVQEKFMRQIPGRIAGRTVDQEGRPGFVLTLSTREQHIRRERATSNICTNQNLMMLAALMHLTLLGREGLAQAARQNVSLMAYLRQELATLPGFTPALSGAVFNELTLRCPLPAAQVVAQCAAAEVVPGLDLGRVSPAWENLLLVNVTETKRREDVDALVDALKGVRV